MKKKNNNVSISTILHRYGDNAADAARKALKDNADMIAKLAKEKCPVKTGKLRDSIHVEVSNGGNKVAVVADAKDKNGVPYGRLVEFSPKINEPYIYPSLDETAEERKNHIIAEIKKALKND